MKMHTEQRQSSATASSALVAMLMCAGMALPALADDFATDSGLSFWGATADPTHFSATQGASLLRPPASWSWDSSAPQLDLAAGVEHRFTNGLNLNLGMSLSSEPENAEPLNNVTRINYRDYFLGLSFGSLEGKLWYLPETAYTDQPALYYEAGWQQPLTNKLSLSLRLGQFGAGYSPLRGYPDRQPSLSLGASTEVRGYGLGLRLIDNGGSMFGGEQDLRLMGSISKPIP